MCGDTPLSSSGALFHISMLRFITEHEAGGQLQRLPGGALVPCSTGRYKPASSRQNLVSTCSGAEAGRRVCQVTPYTAGWNSKTPEHMFYRLDYSYKTA